MNLILLSSFMAIVTTLLQFVPVFSMELKKYSLLDQHIAEAAESLTQNYRELMKLNEKLEILRRSCPAAQVRPDTLLAIQTTAQMLARSQDWQLAKMSLQSNLSSKYTAIFSKPFREVPGACAIPGNLKWLTADIALLKAKKAGAKIFIQQENFQKTQAYWKFYHSELRAPL